MCDSTRGIRTSTYDWNQQFECPLTSGIQYLESRIHSVESRIQDFLGLTFMVRVVVEDVFLNLNSIIDVL